jgi:hypothetical protein
MNTPAPTATPLPTKTATPKPTQAVTPRPTNTKAPVVSSGSGVSSQPSTLEKSIQQAHATTRDMLGLLDQMKSQGGIETCLPLRAKSQSLQNAPVYDIAGQSLQYQQAHSFYRQAIDLVNSRIAAFQGCGSGGGPIGGLDWEVTRMKVAQAIEKLEQAELWAQRVVSVSSSSSLVDATKRIRLAVVSLLTILEKAMGSGEESCEPFLAEYNVIATAPVYDVHSQPANIQNAYGLYRRAIDVTLSRAVPLADMCKQGGGQVYKPDYVVARDTFREAIGYLEQALAIPGQ